MWDAFRNGLWLRPEKPYFFPVSQFPKTPDAVDQFFRQQTPDTGAEPRTKEYRDTMANTMAVKANRPGSFNYPFQQRAVRMGNRYG